jgi:DNA-binding NtrC family response regulator
MKKWIVLFVDDDRSVVTALQRSLRQSPFEIRTANSAAEALKEMAVGNVEAIVSDQDMPGTRGTELLERVCRDWPDTVRIMLTGRPSLDTAIEAVNRGAIWRFLTKPCDPREIEVALCQGLEHRDLLRGARSLIGEVRAREKQLSMLEIDNPGIAKVDRAADGSILLEDNGSSLHSLLTEFESLVKRATAAAQLKA